MKKMLGLALVAMMSTSAFALELTLSGDSSNKRNYADRDGVHDFRLGLLAQFVDSWKIKLESGAGASVSEVDLIGVVGAASSMGQEADLSEVDFLTLSDLKGAISATQFCTDNSIVSAANPGVTACGAGASADDIKITVELSAQIEIAGSLKMNVYAAKEHPVASIGDPMTSIKLGPDTLATSPASAPHSLMTNLNSSGAGYVTDGFGGALPAISIPVEVEFPFKGVNFKASRSDDIVLYAQVESL